MLYDSLVLLVSAIRADSGKFPADPCRSAPFAGH